MKKSLTLLLALIIALSMFSACNTDTSNPNDSIDQESTNEETTETTEVVLSTEPVRVFTLKGPTGMGMAPLLEADSNNTAKLNYEFTIANAADEFTGSIVKGDFEIACVPTNLAAVLNTKTNGAIQVAAVNTLGVLYVLEDGNTINSVEDLNGKTIYSAGQGAVPEYALNYILDTFDIDCDVIYESEHDVVVADLVSNKADVVLLPEPKVTAAIKNENAPENLRVALDLNDLWKEACKKNEDDSALYMGCIIVNKNWAKENPNELAVFLDEYKTSVETVNNDAETASQLIAKFEIIPKAPLAKAALPNANIVFITGEEMKDGLNGFFEVLLSYNPNSVGGAIPGDDFYYSK